MGVLRVFRVRFHYKRPGADATDPSGLVTTAPREPLSHNSFLLIDYLIEAGMKMGPPYGLDITPSNFLLSSKKTKWSLFQRFWILSLSRTFMNPSLSAPKSDPTVSFVLL